MPQEGLEPSRPFGQLVLNQPRLPIPPQGLQPSELLRTNNYIYCFSTFVTFHTVPRIIICIPNYWIASVFFMNPRTPQPLIQKPSDTFESIVSELHDSILLLETFGFEPKLPRCRRSVFPLSLCPPLCPRISYFTFFIITFSIRRRYIYVFI